MMLVEHQLTICRVLCVTIARYLKNLWNAIVIFIITVCLMHKESFALTLDHWENNRRLNYGKRRRKTTV